MPKVFNVLQNKSVETVEEFEELLEVYKVQNPAKFAVKVANGEFDRMRAKLSGVELVAPVAVPVEPAAPAPEVKEEEKEVKKEEPKKK